MRIVHRAIFTLFLITSSVSAADFDWPASRVMQNLSAVPVGGAFADWSFVASPLLSAPVLGYGKPIPISSSQPLAELASLVAKDLGSNSHYTTLTANRTGSFTHCIFRETHDNLPVICGRLDLVVNNRDEIARISLRSFSDWPETGSHAWTLFSVGAKLSAILPPANWQVNTDRSFACWFPDVNARTLRPAFWIALAGSAPHQRHVGIVDAATGEILLEWSGIAHDMLELEVSSPYWQYYNHSETEWAPCVNQRAVLDAMEFVTDATGHVAAEVGDFATISSALMGPYVEVSNDDNGMIAYFDTMMSAPFLGNQLVWDTEHATRPELNLWHHTEFIHDWYKIIDPQFNALDYPMPAVANVGSGYDNAYWNGWGTYYGSGATYDNFAMYSDVIYHEYTHGVTDGIYPDDMLPYIDQPGALNEAWSDYIACSINGDPLMGEWLTGSAHSAMRDLEHNMIFPDNWGNEVHHDSPFISVPLWRLRTWLGIGYTDTLTHFARYALAETFIDYLQAVLETDDDDGNLSNGTPNADQIYHAFGLSGIGPGLEPNFVVTSLEFVDDGSYGSEGNGNGLAEQGETLALTFTVRNDVPLFPPPATNISISLDWTDQSVVPLDLVGGAVGSLAPQETVTFGPARLRVSDDALDHWYVLRLTAECEQSPEHLILAHEFTVGTPRTVIVQKGSPQPVDSFVTRTLRSQDRIYRSFRIDENADLDLSFLPHPGLLIWLSGNASGSHFTQSEKQQIGAYVEAGNFVVLSGKSAFSSAQDSQFLQNLFGVSVAPEFSMFRRAYSVASPFVQDEMFLLAGAGGASNQDTMTVLEPLTGSTIVQRYATDNGRPAGVLGPSGRTLALGFGIEAIGDTTPIGNANAEVFMDRLYQWSGLMESASPEHPRSPEVFSLALKSAYPNPFNSSVNIAYQFPMESEGRLIIRDILGRVVYEAALSESSGEYLWQPSSASGIYFASLEGGNHISNSVKLLYLK